MRVGTILHLDESDLRPGGGLTGPAFREAHSAELVVIKWRGKGYLLKNRYGPPDHEFMPRELRCRLGSNIPQEHQVRDPVNVLESMHTNPCSEISGMPGGVLYLATEEEVAHLESLMKEAERPRMETTAQTMARHIREDRERNANRNRPKNDQRAAVERDFGMGNIVR